MTRFISHPGIRWAMLIGAGGVLAGCNSMGTTTASTGSGYASRSYTPQSFKLPEGKGCSGAVARWEAVQQNDYASGNVNADVYKQIQGELSRAADACSAGRDAEAIRMVAESKRRHGYPS